MVHKIRIPCSVTNLKVVLHFVEKALQSSFFKDNDKHLVTLAIDEVCANLMIHSHKCDPKQSIEIRLKNSHSDVSVEIYDDAKKGFNIAEYKSPDMSQVLTERKSGGMGLILVKKIMDEVKFEQATGGRCVYKLFKSL